MITELFPLKTNGALWAYRLSTKSLGSGKTARVTVKADVYNRHPINKGDIIYAAELYKNNAGYWYISNYSNAPFKFKPKNISYVFGGHCHSDHILRTPLLFKRGMRAPVIMPEGSEPIVRILMEDSARIMACDAADLSKQYGREYALIYTQDHVDLCLAHFREYPMGELIQLDEYVKFRFVPSGHILNAAQIEIYVTEGNPFVNRQTGQFPIYQTKNVKKAVAHHPPRRGIQLLFPFHLDIRCALW